MLTSACKSILDTAGNLQYRMTEQNFNKASNYRVPRSPECSDKIKLIECDPDVFRLRIKPARFVALAKKGRYLFSSSVSCH